MADNSTASLEIKWYYDCHPATLSVSLVFPYKLGCHRKPEKKHWLHGKDTTRYLTDLRFCPCGCFCSKFICEYLSAHLGWISFLFIVCYFQMVNIAQLLQCQTNSRVKSTVFAVCKPARTQRRLQKQNKSTKLSFTNCFCSFLSCSRKIFSSCADTRFCTTKHDIICRL